MSVSGSVAPDRLVILARALSVGCSSPAGLKKVKWTVLGPGWPGSM